jgi:hypothetical protein
MSARKEEIHFHTFTLQSMGELFAGLSDSLACGLDTLEILRGRNEVLAVARKRALP